MTQPIQSVNQTVYLIWLFPATFIRLQLFFFRNIEEKERKTPFKCYFVQIARLLVLQLRLSAFLLFLLFFRFIFRGRIRNT